MNKTCTGQQPHTWTVYSDLSVRCSVCGKPSFRMDTAEWYEMQTSAKALAAYRKADWTTDPTVGGLYPAAYKKGQPAPPIISWAGQGRSAKDGLSETVLYVAALACGLLVVGGITYLALKGIFG